MADWNAIKTEYITTDTSYRKLAEKHGVHKDTIARRAKDEAWADSRRQHTDKTQTKILEAVSTQQATRAAKLQGVAERLLDKIDVLVRACDPLEMDTQSLKHITGAIKDLKEIQMIRSEADIREQEARIANLQKQAKAEDTNREPIRVIIDSLVDEYSK